MRLLHRLALTLIFAGFIFIPAANAAESLAVTAPDLVAPTIEHEMILESAAHGKPVEIHARVTDNVAVKQVELFYRTSGAEAYQRILMQPAQTPGMYTVTLDSAAYPGIEYYIQASDTAGNTLLRGHTLYPLSVRVLPEGEEAPTRTAEEMDGTADKPKKKKKTWLWVGAGIGALVIIGLAAGGSGGGGGDPSASVNVSGPTP